jgi:hypothetical protein
LQREFHSPMWGPEYTSLQFAPAMTESRLSVNHTVRSNTVRLRIVHGAASATATSPIAASRPTLTLAPDSRGFRTTSGIASRPSPNSSARL